VQQPKEHSKRQKTRNAGRFQFAASRCRGQQQGTVTRFIAIVTAGQKFQKDQASYKLGAWWSLETADEMIEASKEA
jgi:hypothetical protein